MSSILRRLLLVGIALLISGCSLLVWAPWLTPEAAGNRAVERFTVAWEGVVDGCGFGCSGCGVVGWDRVLFGFDVDLEYACGLIPEDSPEYHQVDQVFVSVLGTVTGMAEP